MIDLMKQYGKKYKITMDDSWALEKPEFKSPEEKFWYYELHGKRGWCYNQSLNVLAVAIKHSLWPKFERNPAFPYFKKLEGDDFVKLWVNEEHIDKAVHFIRPRKVRTLSEAQKTAAIARLAKFRYKSRTPNHATALEHGEAGGGDQ